MASAQKAKEVWAEKRCISFSLPAYGECSKKTKEVWAEKRCISFFTAPHINNCSRKLAASQLRQCFAIVAMLVKKTKCCRFFHPHTSFVFLSNSICGEIKNCRFFHPYTSFVFLSNCYMWCDEKRKMEIIAQYYGGCMWNIKYCFVVLPGTRKEKVTTEYIKKGM